jgi:hypothetical protein
MRKEGRGRRAAALAPGGYPGGRPDDGFATVLGAIGRLAFSRALIGFAVVLSTAGCASVPFFGAKTARLDQADAKNPAVEIVAFWQPSEGPGPKGVPIRGFGGQVYFLTQSKDTPVAVDGSLRIYLFDDRGSAREQAQPIATYDFDAAHWKNGAHNSPIGPVYSIFVPYPRNDFHQAACSLRIRFNPTVGQPIYSAPVNVTLSGPPTKSDNGDAANIQSPQPQGQVRGQWPQTGGAASLTTSVTFPPFRVPNSRNVIPVNGTDADTRMSLADEVAAPDENRVQTADYSADADTPRASHFRLQSAQSPSSDRDDN